MLMMTFLVLLTVLVRMVCVWLFAPAGIASFVNPRRALSLEGVRSSPLIPSEDRRRLNEMRDTEAINFWDGASLISGSVVEETKTDNVREQESSAKSYIDDPIECGDTNNTPTAVNKDGGSSAEDTSEYLGKEKRLKDTPAGKEGRSKVQRQCEEKREPGADITDLSAAVKNLEDTSKDQSDHLVRNMINLSHSDQIPGSNPSKGTYTYNDTGGKEDDVSAVLHFLLAQEGLVLTPEDVEAVVFYVESAVPKENHLNSTRAERERMLKVQRQFDEEGGPSTDIAAMSAATMNLGGNNKDQMVNLPASEQISTSTSFKRTYTYYNTAKKEKITKTEKMDSLKKERTKTKQGYWRSPWQEVEADETCPLRHT